MAGDDEEGDLEDKANNEDSMTSLERKRTVNMYTSKNRRNSTFVDRAG